MVNPMFYARKGEQRVKTRDESRENRHSERLDSSGVIDAG